MNKVCKDCGNTKPIKDYYHHKGMKDGYLNKCHSEEHIRLRESGVDPDN